MTKDNKFVSVIIPVYNRENCLRRCLDSVRGQSFTDWECVLIDDGSTDGSLDVCREYAAEDDRFLVYHQENQGVSVARNCGLDKAEGKYIAFIDSDDWVEPDYLLRLYDAMEDNGLVLCGITEQWMNGRYEELCEVEQLLAVDASATDTLIRMLENRILTGPVNKLYVRGVIEKEKIRFKPDLHLGEDIVFNCTYLAAIEKMKVIPYCLYHVEKQEGSLSSRILTDRFRSGMVVWRSLYDFFLTKRMYTRTGELFAGGEYCRTVSNCIGMVQHLHPYLTVSERYSYVMNIAGKVDDRMIGRFMDAASCRLAGSLIKKKMYTTLWLLFELKYIMKTIKK